MHRSSFHRLSNFFTQNVDTTNQAFALRAGQIDVPADSLNCWPVQPPVPQDLDWAHMGVLRRPHREAANPELASLQCAAHVAAKQSSRFNLAPAGRFTVASVSALANKAKWEGTRQSLPLQL